MAEAGETRKKRTETETEDVLRLRRMCTREENHAGCSMEFYVEDRRRVLPEILRSDSRVGSTRSDQADPSASSFLLMVA